MKRIFNHSLSLGWFLTVEVIVVVAVLLTLSRLILPFANEFRKPIAAEIENLIGHPVEIGYIEASWSGIKPVIRLIDVEVKDNDSDKSLAAFASVYLKLDPLKSLDQARFVPEKFELTDSSLKFHRDIEGRLRLVGLNAAQNGKDDKSEPLEIKNRLDFSLKNVQIELRDERLKNDFNFIIADASVEMDSRFLRLDSQIKLPDAIGEELHMIFISEGNLARPEEISSEFYLHAEALELKGTSFFSRLDWPQLRQGKLNTTLWGSWTMSDGIDVSGVLSARNAVVTPPLAVQGRNSWEAVSLSTRLHVYGSLESWQLDMDRFELVTAERAWPQSAFSLALDLNSSGNRLRYSGGYLDAGEIINALQVSPLLSGQRFVQLQTMQPDAEIDELVADISWKEDADVKIVASGSMRQMQWQPYQKTPGISALDGKFFMDELGGQFKLSGKDGHLELPQVFNQPLKFSELASTVSWQKQDAGYAIDIENLHLKNQHATAMGMARLQTRKNKKPMLDMEIMVPNLDVKSVRHYIPAKRLRNKKFAGWLQRAFVAGRGKNGLFRYNGVLDMERYKQGKTRLYTAFDVENGILNYRRGWPELSTLNGRVNINNTSLNVRLDYGTMLRTQLSRTQAKIPDLFRSRLAIQGHTDGPFADVFDFLKQSGVAKKNQALIEKVAADGNTRIALDLDIPLSKRAYPGVKPFVKANLDLNRNNIALRGTNVAFEDLSGELRMIGPAFYADNLTAHFRGSPVTGAVTTDVNNTVTVDLSGVFAGEKLLPALAPHITAFSTGNSFWQGQLTIPRKTVENPAAKLKLVARSQLEGTEINLPAPLAKSLGSARSILIDYTFGQIPYLDVEYGRQLKFSAELDASNRFQLIRGVLSLDQTQYKLPDRGLSIRGVWPMLAVDPWEEFLNRLKALSKGGEPLHFDTVATHFDRLDFKGTELRQVSVRANRLADRWAADIVSHELEGNIEFPDAWKNNVPIVVRLRRLSIAGNKEKKKNSKSITANSTLPALDLHVDRFELGQRLLGALSVVTSQTVAGLAIDRVELVGENYFIDAKGDWFIAEGISNSSIAFDARGKNFGSALTELGFGTALGSGSGFVRGELRWVGLPYQVDWPTTSGTMSIDVREGLLLDVDPGLGRLIGLLSIDALPRRLDLDFKDISEEGFQYDSMVGSGSLHNGVLYTSNFKIDSTVAGIELYGKTSMVNHQIEMNMDVTPKLKSTVPLAASVIAGPQTGAIIFLVDKLAESVGVDLNRSVMMKYTVNGDWKTPAIEPLNSHELDQGDDFSGSR